RSGAFRHRDVAQSRHRLADAPSGDDAVRRLRHRQGFGRRGDARYLAVLLRDVYGADNRNLRSMAVSGFAEDVRLLEQAPRFAAASAVLAYLLAPLTPPPLKKSAPVKIVDLSRELYHRTPSY